MSGPETVVVGLLAADAAFTALAADRVFDTRAPSRTVLPYVTFQLIDDPDDRHLQGRSAVRRARVQIDFWAITSGQAKALADAADPALTVTRRGPLGGLDVVQVIRLDTRTGDDGEATLLFRRSADYQVTYSQPGDRP